MIRALSIALLLVLAGCVSRSQSAEEEIAVARRCDARGMNVVLGYRGFPWRDLGYASCVDAPDGVSPAVFIADMKGWL